VAGDDEQKDDAANSRQGRDEARRVDRLADVVADALEDFFLSGLGGRRRET
jgi:hypothetical protein